MTQEIIIGIISLGICAGLIVAGLPDKDGTGPRFLRFHAGVVVYPPTVLVFLAAGVAELSAAFFG